MRQRPGMRSRTWSKSDVVTVVAISAALLLVGMVAYLTRFLLLTVLIGVGVGVLIAPIMSFMHRKLHVPRAVTGVVFVLLVLVGIAGIGYGMGTVIADQASLFVDRAPETFNTIRGEVYRFLTKYPWVEAQIRRLELGRAAQGALNTLYTGVQVSAAAIAGFIVALFISLYVAVNAESYFRAVMSLFPAHMRPRAAMVMHRVSVALRTWFRGQIIVMGVSGALTTIALWALGIEYWLLLGVLTFVMGFIPYVGSILTGVLAFLVTLGTTPDKVWWVLGLYLAIQQIEGDVTAPLVMRGTVQLPEVHLIVLMLVMGSLFGILGVLVAPPLLAVARTVYLLTYAKHMDSLTEAPPQPLRTAGRLGSVSAVPSKMSNR